MHRLFLALLSVPVASAALAQEAPTLRGMVDLKVELDDASLAQIDADVAVLPVFADEDPLATVLAGADTSLSSAVQTAIAQKLLTGKLFQAVPILSPEGMATRRLVLLGAGKESEWSHERLRRLAGAAARSIRTQSVSSLAIFVRGKLPATEAVTAATEGAFLGLFDPGLHKSDEDALQLKALRIGGLGATSELFAIADRATLVARATNMARSITVEPANYLTPEVLANHARAIARDTGLEVEVFDEHQMKEMGMGGVIAVGKGSANPPRFIVLRHTATEASNVTIAFVGKGVCFDSGGISLKDGSGMYRMKGDMAGGATVLAVMRILGELKPGINVMGIVPAVENLPGPTAQKPGDVFVGYSGKTVEVMSTDAEGRLILSDAVAYAVDKGATHVIDIATLTGTVRRALGDRHVGAFSSDDALFARLQEAAAMTGESFWRLPIDDEYARGIKSSLVADLNETGGDAGASIGAKFLQQFTDGKPWIHLDIAGLSWPAYTPSYRAAGPTGVTVRTLAELAMLMGEKGGGTTN